MHFTQPYTHTRRRIAQWLTSLICFYNICLRAKRTQPPQLQKLCRNTHLLEADKNMTRCYKQSRIIVATDPPLKMPFQRRVTPSPAPKNGPAPLQMTFLGEGQLLTRPSKWFSNSRNSFHSENSKTYKKVKYHKPIVIYRTRKILIAYSVYIVMIMSMKTTK